jgi:outer membrane protein assembly factor BamB
MYGVHAWSSNAIIEAAGNLRPVQPLQISEKNGKQVIEFNRQSHKSLSVVGAADKWSKPELHVNALAVGKDAVLVAHALDPKRSGNKRQGATLAVNGWCVTAFDRENGRELWKHNLPIEPLINGLTIADDETILVTLRDGSIVCLN